jgi:hypothetical protein
VHYLSGPTAWLFVFFLFSVTYIGGIPLGLLGLLDSEGGA